MFLVKLDLFFQQYWNLHPVNSSIIHHISISNYGQVWGLQIYMLEILIMDLCAHAYEGKRNNNMS